MPARAQRGRKPAIKRKAQEIEEAVPAKKVFKSPYERDVAQLLDQIKILGERGFPFPGNASNLQMMEMCAAPALFDCLEDRTEMQNEMVRLIDQGFLDMDRRMKEELTTMNGRLAEADNVFANLNGIKEAATAFAIEKSNVKLQATEKLSEKTEAKNAASATWKEANKELKIREKKQEVEQLVLDALVTAYDTEFMLLTKKPEPPAPLPEGEEAPAPVEIVVEEVEKPKRSSVKGRGRRNSAPKEPTTEDRIDRILDQMRLYGADDSLMNALPFALKGALDEEEWSEYRKITLDFCTKFFTEKRMWAEGNLHTAKNWVGEQQTIVNNLWTQLEAATLEVSTCREALTAASEALKIANKDLKTKTQDIADHENGNVATRDRVALMGGWILEMDMCLKSFTMLRERSRPPPPAPEPIVEPVREQVEAMEISEEAAPMEIA